MVTFAMEKRGATQVLCVVTQVSIFAYPSYLASIGNPCLNLGICNSTCNSTTASCAAPANTVCPDSNFCNGTKQRNFLLSQLKQESRDVMGREIACLLIWIHVHKFLIVLYA